jgi:co-chaperonin GroES (HSP10)
MDEYYIEPAGDHVLVADSPREVSIDGIDLPSNMKQQEMVIGVVVWIGPLVSECTKPEQLICYGPYAGKTVVSGGRELRLLREGQIEGYVRTKLQKTGAA